ncbi:LytTR family transcriptional regulator [Actinomyces sp. zg-332]|uniref:LytTR family DNA-binding domain-containing protein n=1 Tax=Actinomyces sp. zg-332 TaxID=2708340 RepID=UPI0014201103|nr:LytTR family transcriptional regulator [Actinomyces sp. zg-332]
MEIEISIDPSCVNPKIVIKTAEVNEQVNSLVDTLSKYFPKVISGFDGEKYEILNEEDLIHIYASNGKVFAQTFSKKYILKFRLYEIEKFLDKTKFVRISKSEIINLKMVENFDLSFSGTICINLKNGIKTYTSRRYVAKIKDILGV